MIAKLDTAATKLSEDKNADALQKLVDFQTTLNALATTAKPKVDPAVAQALITEAQAVIDCINAVGTRKREQDYPPPAPPPGAAGGASLSKPRQIPAFGPPVRAAVVRPNRLRLPAVYRGDGRAAWSSGDDP